MPDAMTDATKTPPDAALDMAPLAELIERLARENAENRAAAALWQERARFLGERLAALEAGPIAVPESPETEYDPQDANPAPQRDAGPHMTSVTLREASAAPSLASERLAPGWRRWWRRITSGGWGEKPSTAEPPG